MKTEQHDRWMGFKRDDVQHWLEVTGLQDVKVVCANEQCCSASLGGNEYARVSIFLAFSEKKIVQAAHD